MSEDLTPMLSQYHHFKKQYPDCLLLFRLGDFYELFYEDAEVGSRELGLVLTSRPAGKGKERIPMCGVPYHSASSYISRLVAKGYKLAICEQLEDASQAKGLVRRDVIRVITPGTYFEKEACGLVGLVKRGKEHLCAYLNPATGEFVGGSFDLRGAKEFILKFSPRELLLPKDLDFEIKEMEVFISRLEEEFFEDGLRALKEEMNIYSAKGLGFEKEEDLLPFGALYLYLKRTQKSFLPYLRRPRPYGSEGYVRIDYRTARGLELLESYDGSERYSLFGVINRTLTGMGRRRLRFHILHPFRDKETIERVQEAVEDLIDKRELLRSIRESLENMPDLERLISRISGGLSTPKDLVHIKKTLYAIENLKAILSSAKASMLKEIGQGLLELKELREDIERTLVDDPPLHLKEGGLIKEGVDPELDQLRYYRDNAQRLIEEYEERLNETRKMLHDPEIRVSATCVRVPVFYGHSEAISVKLKGELSPEEAREILKKAKGVVVVDDPEERAYPIAIEVAGKDEVFVGRIRRDLAFEPGLSMWVVADNIRKGAATNAVQIAELLHQYALV